MKKKVLGVLLGLMGYSTLALGATESASIQRFIGSVDLRPSYISKTGIFYSENSVEAGYRFSPDIAVTYLQGFNTNIHQYSEGLGLEADHGFLRGRFAPLWVSPDESLSFSYQPRVYLPTKASARDASMVAINRNYFTLSKKFSPTFSLSGSLIPIFHFYSQAGSTSSGKASANPIFENRLYVIGDITFTKDLSLSLPLMFHQSRYRTFAGAANSASWGFVLWTYPELSYTLSANTAIGAAYYSDNLVASDLSELTLSDGLENGVFQLSFRAKL